MIWTESDRRAWAWPGAMLTSEWAEANRELGADVTAEPGPWRNARVPYAVGIMDACDEPGVEMVCVPKAAQIAWSEIARNIMGKWIDTDPGPCMIVLPDQKSSDDFLEERLKPLLRDTPAIARHLSKRAWDVKKSSVKLDTMSIYMAWAGSSQGTKSRPIRYINFEEPEEYPAVSGKGGDPISKAMKRLTTYQAKGRAKVLIGSTPTSRVGPIWKTWLSCTEHRHYWVPCPHCNVFQRLYWKNVKYVAREPGETRAQHAARILSDSAPDGQPTAWYECDHCKEKIVESDKLRMLQRAMNEPGRGWRAEETTHIDVGANLVFAQPAAPEDGAAPENTGRTQGSPLPIYKHRRIGFHIPAMYSPWVFWTRMASEWIEAQDDKQALADFINQRLAEPFEEQRAKTEPGLIQQKAIGASPKLIVPGWTRLLIATADTQGTCEKDGYFWYVIRAWTFGYHSQMVDFGVASSFGELRQKCLERLIPVEGNSGRAVAPQLLVIDSGGPRWTEVYEFSQSDTRIHPAKGFGLKDGKPSKINLMVVPRPQKKHGIVLWNVNANESKDLLHRLIHDPDQTKWLPFKAELDDAAMLDYCSQMCSEIKIFDPKSGREVWTEVVQNNNHLHDAEALQCAAAWFWGMGAPEPEAPPPPVKKQKSESEWLNPK